LHLKPNPPIRPYRLTPENPLPENAMDSDTGNAGLDGYTVLSRASRHSGQRPNVGGQTEYEAPLPNYPFFIEGTF
jgi:hypothetical protein